MGDSGGFAEADARGRLGRIPGVQVFMVTPLGRGHFRPQIGPHRKSMIDVSPMRVKGYEEWKNPIFGPENPHF